MTDTPQLLALISKVKSLGGKVTVEWDATAKEREGRDIISTVQIQNMPGCGPHPMSPISAAERMREIVTNILGRKNFASELVLEHSSSPRTQPLGMFQNDMTLRVEKWDAPGVPKSGFIQWNYGRQAPDEDETIIGVWFDGKTVSDYDGVFELPVQAAELLIECGFDVSEVSEVETSRELLALQSIAAATTSVRSADPDELEDTLARVQGIAGKVLTNLPTEAGSSMIDALRSIAAETTIESKSVPDLEDALARIHAIAGTEILASEIPRFEYHINLDERGSFYADVRNAATNETVFEIKAGNELGEDETSIFEDGFMRDKHDMDGLTSYLTDLGIIPQGAEIVSSDSQRRGLRL